MPCRALAVTLGDPRGIGPEVAMAAAARLAEDEPDVTLVWFVPRGRSDDPVLADGEVHALPDWDGSEPDAGRLTLEALDAAVSAALQGRVAGVVTGPAHKPALHAAGHAAPGQTEILRDLAGVDSVGMLMCAERTRLGAPLRVLLATTHVALRDVPELVTAELLVEQTALLERHLRSDWGIAEPRIALCALNPHASDGGLFGDEETRVFGPALDALRNKDVRAQGPLPADTVFARAVGGAFDAVVAPYHDVGMAAFKTVSFGSGVNVTLGLPFVRTSPDHGTAFDIAGSGKADSSSMLEALRLAARLARHRFDTSPERHLT